MDRDKVRAENQRLALVLGSLVGVVVLLNYARFGDLLSIRDCFALKQIVCVPFEPRSAGSTSDGRRMDGLLVRNLTLSPIRVFGVHNSCGPILGNDGVVVPAFSQTKLYAWEKETNKKVNYKIFHGLSHVPLVVQIDR